MDDGKVLLTPGSTSLRSLATKTTTCSPRTAAMSATLLLGCYRSADAAVPKVYVAAMTAVLRCYRERVVSAVCDPVNGLPSQSKWLPSIAEIKEACEKANGTWHPPAGTLSPNGYVHDGRGGFDFLANPKGRKFFYDD